MRVCPGTQKQAAALQRNASFTHWTSPGALARVRSAVHHTLDTAVPMPQRSTGSDDEAKRSEGASNGSNGVSGSDDRASGDQGSGDGGSGGLGSNGTSGGSKAGSNAAAAQSKQGFAAPPPHAKADVAAAGALVLLGKRARHADTTVSPASQQVPPSNPGSTHAAGHSLPHTALPRRHARDPTAPIFSGPACGNERN